MKYSTETRVTVANKTPLAPTFGRPDLLYCTVRGDVLSVDVELKQTRNFGSPKWMRTL